MIVWHGCMVSSPSSSSASLSCLWLTSRPARLRRSQSWRIGNLICSTSRAVESMPSSWTLRGPFWLLEGTTQTALPSIVCLHLILFVWEMWVTVRNRSRQGPRCSVRRARIMDLMGWIVHFNHHQTIRDVSVLKHDHFKRSWSESTPPCTIFWRHTGRGQTEPLLGGLSKGEGPPRPMSLLPWLLTPPGDGGGVCSRLSPAHVKVWPASHGVCVPLWASPVAWCFSWMKALGSTFS